MLYLPPDPKQGESIKASTLTAILKYLRQITPRTGASCDVLVGPGGTTHRPRFRRHPRALLSAAPTHPYQGINASAGSTPGVIVVPGAHNSIIPTISGVVLNYVPAPVLVLSAGPGIVYVEVDWNTSGQIDTCEINSSTGYGGPPANVFNTDGSATTYQTLFTYNAVITGGAARVTTSDIVLGSQSQILCGNNVLSELV